MSQAVRRNLGRPPPAGRLFGAHALPRAQVSWTSWRIDPAAPDEMRFSVGYALRGDVPPVVDCGRPWWTAWDVSTASAEPFFTDGHPSFLG